MLFSFIISLFNRPEEIRELLQSIAAQSYKNLEVIVVEDGSTLKAEDIVKSFAGCFPLQYLYKPNAGPGPARNDGCEHARGDYFIFVDSDCLLPPHYLDTIHRYLLTRPLDAFGGPDAAHPSFTPLQKAISYAMTSFLTSGGIRGRKPHLGVFQPRSFNMGISKRVYLHTKGFSPMRFGEDIELSTRIHQEGFSTGLIADAFVYHRRRTDLKKFFKQVHNSGIARINLYKRHPETLQAVHFFPACFTLACLSLPLIGLVSRPLFLASATLFVLYTALVFADAAAQSRSVTVAGLSTVAAYAQLIGYGSGFLQAVWRRILLGQEEFSSFQDTFYQ